MCTVLSNNATVQDKLEVLFWVLIVHTQSRIGSCGSAQLLIPVGYGCLQTWLTFVSFYGSAFLAALVALTDVVNTSTITKMLACVGLTSLAQILQCFAFYGALYRMNWEQA